MRKTVTVHLIQVQSRKGIVVRRVGNIIHPVGNHSNLKMNRSCHSDYCYSQERKKEALY